jgi:phosphate starvation-inducible PhoH-like protein
VILADEMQNATKTELKMLLTRMGRNCKLIISGDIEQADILDSGLPDAINRLEGIPGIEVVRFMDSDIVRSAICKKIILAYRK